MSGSTVISVCPEKLLEIFLHHESGVLDFNIVDAESAAPTADQGTRTHC